MSQTDQTIAPERRRDQILAYLSTHDRSSVGDLSHVLGVSEVTMWSVLSTQASLARCPSVHLRYRTRSARLSLIPAWHHRSWPSYANAASPSHWSDHSLLRGKKDK